MAVVSGEMARALRLSPVAKTASTAVVGLEPSVMGHGPVPATMKALLKLKLSVSDIDMVELNEAFAAQALSVLKDLGNKQDSHEKTNLQSGAIALGHPFGCSGTRITESLLSVMKGQDPAIGLATMCIGLEQGIALPRLSRNQIKTLGCTSILCRGCCRCIVDVGMLL